MSFLADLRYAARVLRRSPAFTVISILCLAIGIGANSAVFSVVNTVLLRPLPYDAPERLVVVWNQLLERDMPYLWASNAEFLDYREQNQTFDKIAAYFHPINLNLMGPEGPERTRAATVSAGFFEILGVEPSVGRRFTPEEDLPGNDTVVVLSHGFWQRYFGGQEDAIGQTVNLRGTPYTVVGIMPPDFKFFPDSIELWVPLGVDATNPGARNSRYLFLLGQLADGVSVAQAQANMSSLAKRLEETYPEAYPEGSGWGILVRSLAEEVVGDVRPALGFLMIVVLLVLLIACANVANMLLVRSTLREREVAVRTALGSSRRQLAQQFFAEGLLLSLLGGSLGLFLGYSAMKSMVALRPESLPRADEIGFDFTLIAFTLGLTCMTGLFFALVPVWHSFKTDLRESLKENVAGSGSRRNRLRYGLVIAEVALVLVLLVAAGLMMRSFLAVQNIQPGFQTENVLTGRLFLPSANYPEEHQWTAFYRELTRKIAALPQVESAGTVSQLPLSGSEFMGGFTIENRPLADGEARPIADWRIVESAYFSSLGIDLVDGRTFSAGDDAEATDVAIIDRSLAERFWPDRDPLGQRLALTSLRPDAPWLRIVGIVDEIKHYGLESESRGQIYVPLAQLPNRSMYIVARTTTEPRQLIPEIRAQIRDLDPNLPLSEVETMTGLLSQSTSQRRLSTSLFGLFALIGLVLAALGIYGVMSYTIAQRRREIGLRMALGASKSSVLALVLKQSLMLTGLGIVIGLGVSFALTGFMDHLIFGIGTHDLGTFVGVAALLLIIASVAAIVPGRRATSIEPNMALRHE